MFIEYFFQNLLNFKYEITFFENLWFYHFIDFCLLLTFKDFIFITFLLYIVILSILNLSILINKINVISILFSPFKLFSDILIIYII